MNYDEYTIWHDADYDVAYWVYRNTNLFGKKVTIKELPKNTTSNILAKTIIDESDLTVLPLIKYDHPDIIITGKSGNTHSAICLTEFMTHTPQWQHPAQRFSRIYGASNLKIPSALILPFIKTRWERKNNKEYKETHYKISNSVHYLFEITEKMTKTPTRVFRWGDRDGYLRLDKKSPTAPHLDESICQWIDFINMCIDNTIQHSNTVQYDTPQLDDFDTIDGMENTAEYMEKNNIDPAQVNFDICEKSVIFGPTGLSPNSGYFRTDPYAGMLCAFENILCKNTEDGSKIHNIVLRAKNVELAKLFDKGTFSTYVEHDESKCPFEHFFHNIESFKKHIEDGCTYMNSKQQRIYGQIDRFDNI